MYIEIIITNTENTPLFLSHTFAWMNFSFTDRESDWQGLGKKNISGLSDLLKLHNNRREYQQ